MRVVGSVLGEFGQAHHTEAEEADNIAGVGVEAGGHHVLGGRTAGNRAPLARGKEEAGGRNGGRSAACQVFEEIAAGYGLVHVSVFI